MIATIRFKDILKYLVITTILIGIFVFIARFFFANKKGGSKRTAFFACIYVKLFESVSP